MCNFCLVYLLFLFIHLQECRLVAFRIWSFDDNIFVFSFLNFCFCLQYNIYPFMQSWTGKPTPKSYWLYALWFGLLWSNTILIQMYWPLLEKHRFYVESQWKTKVCATLLTCQMCPLCLSWRCSSRKWLYHKQETARS